MTKKCPKCGETKSVDEFPKDKYNVTGYGPYCKVCKQARVKVYYGKNREARIDKNKQWNKDNPDKVKQYNAGRQDYQKQYALDNKDKIYDYQKKWRREKYPPKPKRSKEERKLVNVYRDRVKRGIQTDRKKTFELLGCTFPELKKYIETQFYPEMSWDNWGKVWELDHIQGCVTFDLNDPEQVKKCFHYTNLRPLFKTTTIAQSFGYHNIEGNRNRKKHH